MTHSTYNPYPRPRRARKMHGVQNILTSTLRRFNIDKDIARYQFILHWKEIVGAEIARRTKPECFRGDALVVRVVDSVWAQELTFQKEVILKRLQKFLDHDQVVSDIFFVVGKIGPVQA